MISQNALYKSAVGKDFMFVKQITSSIMEISAIFSFFKKVILNLSLSMILKINEWLEQGLPARETQEMWQQNLTYNVNFSINKDAWSTIGTVFTKGFTFNSPLMGIVFPSCICSINQWHRFFSFIYSVVIWFIYSFFQ